MATDVDFSMDLDLFLIDYDPFLINFEIAD